MLRLEGIVMTVVAVYASGVERVRYLHETDQDEREIYHRYFR
jgi:hypothetical protein